MAQYTQLPMQPKTNKRRAYLKKRGVIKDTNMQKYPLQPTQPNFIQIESWANSPEGGAFRQQHPEITSFSDAYNAWINQRFGNFRQLPMPVPPKLPVQPIRPTPIGPVPPIKVPQPVKPTPMPAPMPVNKPGVTPFLPGTPYPKLPVQPIQKPPTGPYITPQDAFRKSPQYINPTYTNMADQLKPADINTKKKKLLNKSLSTY